MKRILIVISLLIVLISCGKKEEIPDNVLLRFENQFLVYDDIINKIPSGLQSADSIALFNALVDSWLQDVILADFAEQRLLDTAIIDRKVKDYRNSLIVQEYLRKMRESKTPKIDEQDVMKYYNNHRNDLKLEVPLVKGIFLKISSDSKGKEEIKGLLSSKEIEAIDKLEQNWMDRALEYNYFRDKWIDWETVSRLIPYRFGDPEAFLTENKYFEIENDGCHYYLQISDYLPGGDEQPYEFARSWIIDMLWQVELGEYEKALVNSLINSAIKDKKLETVSYDPFKHEIKEKLR